MLETLTIRTPRRSATVDITDPVLRKVQERRKKWALFPPCPHTTACIMVNEGADPAVMEDVLNALDKLVPWQAEYHHSEGNSAAHIKAILVGGRTSLIVENGRLVLGTWERIFLCEFDGPRTRKIHVKIIGDR